MAKKSIIYIDGFNLYYGALKSTAWKWLNLQRYFERLRQDDDVQQIRYFTAPVLGPSEPDQQTYLLALDTLPKVQIIFGRFKSRAITCTVQNCRYRGNRVFTKPEEKRTDVNIAIHMLNDAIHADVERLVLVSGDSDLAPALHMIKTVRPEKELWVYVPARDPIRGAAVELRGSADKNRTLPMTLLKHCQFPAQLPDGADGVITKPSDW